MPAPLTFSPFDRIQLTNGRFVDVIRGKYFDPSVSLIVQHGKIFAMPGLPDEPAHIHVHGVIDLHGKTVIPGLFNTHCHLQMMSGVLDQGELRQRQIARNLNDCLERGITNIRDALCTDLRLNRDIIGKIDRGELPGPRVQQAVHVSPLGGTYAPHQTLPNKMVYKTMGMPLVDYHRQESGVVAFSPRAGEQEVRDAVDEAIADRGAQTIKFCDQSEQFLTYKPGAAVITQAQLEAAADQARKRRVPTTIHNVSLRGFRQSVQAGLTSLAHQPLDGELEKADVDALLNANCCIEPTLTVAYYMSWGLPGSRWEGDEQIRALDAFRDQNFDALVDEAWLPEFQTKQRSQVKALRSGEMKLFGLFDMGGPFRFYAAMFPVGAKNFRSLLEWGAGSRIAVGNDASISACSPASIHLELEMMDFSLAQAGKSLAGVEALRMATLQSARAMGIEYAFGSLNIGKTADLVLLDGDPLRDPRVIGSPAAAVFMDGQVVVDKIGLTLAPASGT